MASVNKTIILGNLGADPELRYTAGGSPVAELRIATNRRFKSKDGEWQDETEWHRVVVWGKQAEACGQYLSKGRLVYIEGSIQTRNYEDKSGVKKYVTEIIASRVQFLGGGERQSAPAGESVAPPIDPDDTPF